MFAPQTLGLSLPASSAVFKVDLFVRAWLSPQHYLYYTRERLIAINGNARFPLSAKALTAICFQTCHK